MPSVRFIPLVSFELALEEGSIESDDQASKPISVGFSFSAPTAFAGTAAGTTDGLIEVFTTCGLIAGGCGELDWANSSSANPLVLGFGTNGQLGIWLENEVFATPGSRVVDVSFKLLRQDTPVATPEPGSMVLFGTGLICAVSRLRRRQRTSPA